jgi:hypothetical protein
MTPNWIKECVPHAKVEMIAGHGHVLCIGPNQATQDRFTKAVADMPPLVGGAAASDMEGRGP